MSEAPSENLPQQPKTEILRRIPDRVRMLVALILIGFLSLLHAAELPIGIFLPLIAAAVLAALFYPEWSTRNPPEHRDDSFDAVTLGLGSLTQVLPGASFHLPVGEPTHQSFLSEGAADIYDMAPHEFHCLADLDRPISVIDRATTEALRNESIAHG